MGIHTYVENYQTIHLDTHFTARYATFKNKDVLSVYELKPKSTWRPRLAQSGEHVTLDLGVVILSPMMTYRKKKKNTWSLIGADKSRSL